MTAVLDDLPAQLERALGKLRKNGHKRKENSSYYESERRPDAIGLSVPPAMKKLLAKIGWPRMYIDSLEERLDVEGFRTGKDTELSTLLWQWWQSNGMDVQSGLGHTEALIHGVAYVSVAAPATNDPLVDPSTPCIRVESPDHMYAEVDPRTLKVLYAVRSYKDPLNSSQDRATLYLPNSTHYFKRGRSGWVQDLEPVKHGLGVVPIVPLLNKKRMGETNGASEIFPELRSQTDAAARLMMNMNATAELMAQPQRVLFGVKRDELLAATATGATWEAYIANILAFGGEGSVTQLAAAELRNFGDGMQEISRLVAGFTGLPPQYLAFSQDNPASADAIRASEYRLVKKAERKCRIFGEAWEQVMRVAMLVMKKPLTPDAFRMETVWRNPATPTFAAQADGVLKLATTVTPEGPAVMPLEFARRRLEFSEAERDEMKAYDEKVKSSRLFELYGGATGPAARPQFSDSRGGAEE